MATGNWAGHGFATRAIHAGQPPDGVSGAVIPPISLSTTFAQQPGSFGAAKYDYSRSGNPTRDACEACIASCEGGAHGLAFSSGLAATATLLQTLSPGDRVVVCDDVYGGTNRLMSRVAAASQGLLIEYVDMADAEACRAAIAGGGGRPPAKLVWVESPTNPTLKLVDIRLVAGLASAAGAVSVVDNTFLSPFFQSPLALGTTVVLHSCTKYLNGHSDCVMGALVLNDGPLHTRLRFLQNAIGSVPSPFDCFLVLRGLKTLAVRMRAHADNALQVATLLESHPKVDRVSYPGLDSHPQRALALSQASGAGGMVTFWLAGDSLESARSFLGGLRIFALAESLGGVESLAEHPGLMTHASVPEAQRRALGITDGLVRLSVGLEDGDDLVADVRQALDGLP